MSMDCLTDLGERCRLTVQITPKARKNAVVGVVDGALRIKIAAQPVKGAANKQLITFLARKLLRIPRASVRIVRGDRARHKQIEIDSPAEDVAAAIQGALSR